MATAYEKFLQLATSNTIRCSNQWEIMATSGIDAVDEVLKDGVVFVQGFVIPSRTVNYTEVAYKGYSAPLVPTNLEMTKEFAFDVIEDVNGSLRRAFLAWQNAVIDADIENGSVFAGNRGVNEKSLIRLQLFDKDNETVIQTYKFFNVGIKSVGENQLQYEGGDKILFNVQCNCTYWTLEESKKGALTNLH